MTIQSPPPGRVSTTTPSAVAVAAVAGAAVGVLVNVIANAFDATPPLVPWTAPLTVAAFAAMVGALARSTQQRIQVRHERMESSRAVAFLVLGKASALAGAFVAAGYLAYALLFVARFDVEGPRERVIRSGLAAVAGVAWLVTGLLLERACKVPRRPQDEEDDDR